MKWLLLTHVLSAVIGIGPTFFAHYLTRTAQSVEEFKFSYKTGKALFYLPMFGSPIAVITGIILAYLYNYNIFATLWLYGSLFIYVIIQLIAVFFLHPTIDKIAKWVEQTDNVEEFPMEQKRHIKHVNWALNAISILSIILFTLMVLKPN